MIQILESFVLSREAYQASLGTVCARFRLTVTELVILLFLAEHPRRNTATDIVHALRLTKSSVSMSVRDLQERGLLQGAFSGGNHRSIHLQLCSEAHEIVDAGLQAQSRFFAALTRDFSPEELQGLREYCRRMSKNLYSCIDSLHEATPRADSAASNPNTRL